jgi:hypothetical protein
MESRRELFHLANGPSSSYTFSPCQATETFRQKYPASASIQVTFYGSPVKIYCIEPSIIATTRILSRVFYAFISNRQDVIPFEKTLQVMEQSGQDLPRPRREASSGGLALSHCPNKAIPIKSIRQPWATSNHFASRQKEEGSHTSG